MERACKIIAAMLRQKFLETFCRVLHALDQLLLFLKVFFDTIKGWLVALNLLVNG